MEFLKHYGKQDRAVESIKKKKYMSEAKKGGAQIESDICQLYEQ